jgi:hypothetical protein
VLRLRSFPLHRRLIAFLFLPAAAVCLLSSAGAASKPQSFSFVYSWTASGSRVVVAGDVRKPGAKTSQTGLWTMKFGSGKLKHVATTCGPGTDEFNQIALGPNGIIGCLENRPGNTEAYVSLGVVLASGKTKQVVSLDGPADMGTPIGDWISTIFGDGNFLGYTYVTADKVVRLYQITATGGSQYVADLAGISGVPLSVSVDSGRIAVTQPLGIHLQDGDSISVYAVSGEHISTFSTAIGTTWGPLVAIRKDRVVVLAGDPSGRKLLNVYTLQGQAVHSYPLKVARSHVATDLATYGGYAVFVERSSSGIWTIHAVKLATGVECVVARAGSGYFWNGVSIKAPGIVAPLTTPHSGVELLYVPMKMIRKELG